MILEIGKYGISDIADTYNSFNLIYINMKNIKDTNFILIEKYSKDTHKIIGASLQIDKFIISFPNMATGINFLKFLELKEEGIDKTNINNFAEIIYKLDDEEMKYSLLKKFKNDYQLIANLSKELDRDDL